jgi:hypothetical protein
MRALFARALLANPESEAGWLWFATVAEDPGEQRYALNRALAINPESAGLHRLVLLPRGPATTPPDLSELDEPPLPLIWRRRAMSACSLCRAPRSSARLLDHRHLDHFGLAAIARRQSA